MHPLCEPIELAPTPDGKAWQTVTTYQSRCGAVDAVLGPTPGARAKTWHVVEKVVGPSSSSADCAGGAPAEFRSDRKPTAMKCEQIDLCGSCTLR